MRGLANEGISNGVIVEKYIKHLNRNYDKGIVLNGKVIPFNASLWEKEELETAYREYFKLKRERELKEFMESDYYDPMASPSHYG